jgi:hypothetical protein
VPLKFEVEGGRLEELRVDTLFWTIRVRICEPVVKINFLKLLCISRKLLDGTDRPLSSSSTPQSRKFSPPNEPSSHSRRTSRFTASSIMKRTIRMMVQFKLINHRDPFIVPVHTTRQANSSSIPHPQMKMSMKRRPKVKSKNSAAEVPEGNSLRHFSAMCNAGSDARFAYS